MKCIIVIVVYMKRPGQVAERGQYFYDFVRMEGTPKVVTKWLDQKRKCEGYSGFALEESKLFFNEQELRVGQKMETPAGWY